MAKIRCPGCGAEIDTEAGTGIFPPSDESETELDSQADGDAKEPTIETPLPAPAEKRRSRYFR